MGKLPEGGAMIRCVALPACLIFFDFSGRRLPCEDIPCVGQDAVSVLVGVVNIFGMLPD